jgi:hypothetical protein
MKTIIIIVNRFLRKTFQLGPKVTRFSCNDFWNTSRTIGLNQVLEKKEAIASQMPARYHVLKHLTSKHVNILAYSLPFNVVIDVVEMISFLAESYKSSPGDKESWAITAKYQVRNFFESPLNLGHSDLDSVERVIILEKISVNKVNIWDWKSEDGPEVATGTEFWFEFNDERPKGIDTGAKEERPWLISDDTEVEANTGGWPAQSSALISRQNV